MQGLQDAHTDQSPSNILSSFNAQDYKRIRYTQRYINTTFSDYKLMNVFDTYFAVKYQFICVTDLPPIRVFQYERQLWSFDNRRLWIMKQTNQFNCEGPIAREQNPELFRSFFKKRRRSLKGESGVHVLFMDKEPKCCRTAFNQGKLDIHIAEVHLKTSLDNIKYLAKSTSSDLLEVKKGTLYSLVHERCQLLKSSIDHSHMQPSEQAQQLLSTFN